MECFIEGCDEPRLPARRRCRRHYNEHRRTLDRQPHIRERQAAYMHQYKYGLSWQEHLILLEKQDDQCAGCGADGPLHVDHCHTEGHVRGLLCGNCNRALGLVRDSTETLEALIDYVS